MYSDSKDEDVDLEAGLRRRNDLLRLSREIEDVCSYFRGLETLDASLVAFIPWAMAQGSDWLGALKDLHWEVRRVQAIYQALNQSSATQSFDREIACLKEAIANSARLFFTLLIDYLSESSVHAVALYARTVSLLAPTATRISPAPSNALQGEVDLDFESN